MKRMLMALVCVGMVMTTGCKLEHNSRVKQSQLLGEIKTIESSIRVEVASCSDHQNASRPSKNLSEVSDLMKKLFPDSEFDGCKREGMNSIATYTTPIEVGTQPPAQKYEPKGIGIIRNSQGIVLFCLSKGVRDSIVNGRKNPMTKDLALKVNIRFTNDTESELKIVPHAAFSDGDPFACLPSWQCNVVLKNTGTTTLMLSDVSSEFAIKQGVVPVFTEQKKE
jgi:hypothetical protein